MKKFDDEYFALAASVPEVCRKAALRQRSYLVNESTARYHGRVVYTLFMPKLFSAGEIRRMQEICRTSLAIFDKVIARYETDADFRAAFGFSKELEELILLDPGYGRVLPVSRLDIFFNEDENSPDYMDFHFCEINTDGSSAMNEDRELVYSLQEQPVFQAFSKTHRLKPFELFDSLCTAFLGLYGKTPFAAARPKPNVAIVDFNESATTQEFLQFQAAFQRRGLACEVCDIRELTFAGGVLRTKSGMPVDLVYRRAVTSDILRHVDEVQPFLAAAKSRAVCLMGGFKTQIIHSKTLFEVLCNKTLTEKFLTPEEMAFIDRHVPKTYALRRDNALIDLDAVKRERRKWIVKPAESYGSRGVLSGVECETQAEWAEFIEKCLDLDEHYILQQFIEPYRSRNLDFIDGAGFADVKKYSNLTGMFCYAGQFAGLYSRVAANEIISTIYSEIALPSFAVEEKPGQA